SYENLRKFDPRRFTEPSGGGRSDGYYFSEKILNVIRAADLSPLRNNNLLDQIRNEENIFSDIILDSGYSWNTYRPDIHKNYLLSIGQLLKQISEIKNIEDRKDFVLEKIDQAIGIYRNIYANITSFSSEGENYHLNIWKTYLSNM